LFAAELEKYKQENAEEVERQKNVTSEMLESVANSKMELENIHKQIDERMKGQFHFKYYRNAYHIILVKK
jgi:hypothetical protein